MAGVMDADLREQCTQAIDKICALARKKEDGRPFRVVFLGKHGSGKSSFINSAAAAFSQERWHEYAYSGFHGDGRPITVFTQKFEKCANEDMERYMNVPLPTLIDVAGAMDIDNDRMVELLRLLLYGHIQNETAIMEAYEFCADKKNSIAAIRRTYSECYPDMRVDRVVFVASAEDKLPEKFMSCVLEAARPSHSAGVHRALPVYGVLTKKDKVKDPEKSEFKDKKKTFMENLGLQSNRFLFCSNYCDDTDPASTRHEHGDPSLDLPILEFFQRLCDPAQRVPQDNERLPGTESLFSLAFGFLWRPMAVVLMAYLVYCAMNNQSPLPFGKQSVRNVDVTLLSLGVGTGEMNYMKVLIKRNTSIPTSASNTFTTASDHQTSVEFEIYMGERAKADDNVHIGTMNLREISPAPRGTPDVTVTFDIDAEGVLKVTAKDKDSGQEAKVTIENPLDGFSKEDIAQMIEDSEAHREEDEKWTVLVSAMSQLEDFAHKTKRAAHNQKAKERMPEKDYQTVMDACDDALKWLDTHGRNSAEEQIEQKRRELERKCSPIMARYV